MPTIIILWLYYILSLQLTNLIWLVPQEVSSLLRRLCGVLPGVTILLPSPSSRRLNKVVW